MNWAAEIIKTGSKTLLVEMLFAIGSSEYGA
jgi:hypothetical protein